MKKIFVLFWVVFCGLHLFSQVPVVELNSQSQVDSFNMNYPNFYGNLIINGTDIENLDSLCHLIEIDELWITTNPNLNNIVGLNNLKTAKEIHFYYNSGIEVLDGFLHLQVVDNSIGITGNVNLKAINGFNELTSINRITISENAGLGTIIGFNSLNQIGISLLFILNNKLKVINGFMNLKSISDNSSSFETVLSICHSDSLSSLNVFQNLQEVDQISIQYCPLIESLDGLQNIESNIQVLGLVSNASLSDISALETVPFAEDAELLIHDNPTLDFCSISGICGLENPWNQIYNNAPGCDSWHEIDSICSLISVTESAVPGFTLFPNPVKDELTVNFGSNQNDFALSLYSVTGILIRTYQVYGDNFRMDVSDLPGGVYMLFIDNSFAVKFLKL